MPAPRHPHAWVTVDLAYRPALILDWEKIPDSHGLYTWWATVVYIDAGGEVKQKRVAEQWVKPA